MARISLLSLALPAFLLACGDKSADSGSANDCTETTWYADADGDGYAGDQITVSACEAPDGFFETAEDCDDLNADTKPLAQELCDGLDNDCDGEVDEEGVDPRTFYKDLDGDGYGDTDSTEESCSAPEGYAELGGDCDDFNAAVNPESKWYLDEDLDGYGDSFTFVQLCEAPAGYLDNGDDCDDSDPSINPDGIEACDGDDNNCDGAIDEDTAVDAIDFYEDADEDGWGGTGDPVTGCTQPSGYAPGFDCDDDNDQIFPWAVEDCSDTIDNDCNGIVNNTCPVHYTSADSDIRISGVSNGDYPGRGLDVGDLNNDGTPDLVVGAYGADSPYSFQGSTFVVWGPLSDGQAMDSGLEIAGENSGDQFGYGASVGDINDDGVDDLVVCSGNYDTGGYSLNGALYGFYGPLDSNLDDASDFDVLITGEGSSDFFGRGSRATADFNGDGVMDLLTGSYGADAYYGATYIFHGPLSGSIAAADADVLIAGSEYSDYMGRVVSTGDVNGDGTPDVIIGGDTRDQNGKLAVFHGPVTGNPTGDDGDTFLTGNSSGDGFGVPNTAGDVNGDGYDDVAAGAYGEDVSGAGQAGAVFLFHGGPTGTDDEAAWQMVGQQASTYLGHYVTRISAGDINSDGKDDLAFGSYHFDDPDNDDQDDQGAAFLVYGPMSGSFTSEQADIEIYGDAGDEQFGYRTLLRDADGDGEVDLLGSNYGTTSTTGQIDIFLSTSF